MENNIIKNNIKNLLITYNILFYYHNEDIKLIDYYLDNLKTMFNNLSNTNDTNIQFIINFIVSDLDNFIANLESHINITKIESSNNIYKINETLENFLETKFQQIKINNYDFNIIIHQNISYPYKFFNKYNFENIHYENKTINKLDEINFGKNSIGFKRYVGNIMTWNIHNKIENENIKILQYQKIITCVFQIDFGTRIGLPVCLHPDVKNIEYGKSFYNINFEDKDKNPLLKLSKYF